LYEGVRAGDATKLNPLFQRLSGLPEQSFSSVVFASSVAGAFLSGLVREDERLRYLSKERWDTIDAIEERVRKETVTGRTERTELMRLDADGRRKTPFVGRRRRRRQAEDTAAGEKEEPEEPGHQLDVEV
jgi:hypothetical protein